jgi:hypothetical protein
VKLAELHAGALVEASVVRLNGCRWDEVIERDHAQRYDIHVGWHSFVPPTDAQRLARARERRALRRYAEALAAGLSEAEACEDGWPRGEL